MILRRLFPSLVFTAVFAVCTAHAQSGGDYTIVRNAHTGGGLVDVAGGDYALGGSIGQPDAGELTGGDFVLVGGFWGPGGTTVTDAGPGGGAAPLRFASRLASANPFRTSTSLAFELPSPRRVSLAVYGVDGRAVRHWPLAERNAGRHVIAWDGRDDDGRRAAPGVYFLRLQAGDFSATHRVVRLD